MDSYEKRQKLAPFVNLRSDVGFKAVFADRNNKDILIGVLNLILPPEARIEDIKEYSDREQQRDVTYGKKTVLDLVCVDKDDRTFVVEMQADPEDYFFERCVYYASGLYHLELSDGERYMGLHPVYVVSFLNYRLRHDDESLWDTDHFISYWQFTEKRTGMVADQTISVIFVLEECVTEFDRLFYIFRNSGGFQKIPEWIEENGGISRRLAEACEVAAFDKVKKLKYEIDKMNEWDIQAQREYAVRKGLEEGLKKGLQEGLEQGLEQGREQGREQGLEQGLEQGREEAKLSIARKLFEAGTPIDVIINCTGVDKGTIASFARSE